MNYALLMELATRIGCGIAKGGAETYRVEESINRMMEAYGVESRVYSVPNSLIITILVPGQPPMTQLCRMERCATDLDAVEQYSNLGRRICWEKPDLETAFVWLEEAQKARKRYSFGVVLLGYMLVAWGFCIFFGGSLMDSVCAIACGLLLGVVERWMGKLESNVFFMKVAAAFLTAALAYSISTFGLTPNVDTAVIGVLMILVPGVLFTNAMRDIIFGDTHSGTNRVVEALLIGVAVAIGTAIAWNLVNGLCPLPQQVSPREYNWVITCAVSLVACSGFVFVFNIHGHGAWLCALGGMITWGVYCLAQKLDCGSYLCCFLAACVASGFSEIMARVRKYPAISYLVISLLPLIPGAGVYYMALYAIGGQMSLASQYGRDTLAVAGVMAAGILVVSTAVRMWKTHHAKRNVCSGESGK